MRGPQAGPRVALLCTVLGPASGLRLLTCMLVEVFLRVRTSGANGQGGGLVDERGRSPSRGSASDQRSLAGRSTRPQRHLRAHTDSDTQQTAHMGHTGGSRGRHSPGGGPSVGPLPPLVMLGSNWSHRRETADVKRLA